MSDQSPPVVVDGYLIVEATHRTAQDVAVRGRLIGTRVNMPYLSGDQIAIRVRLRIPAQAFGPVRIVADITVDETSIPQQTIVLEPTT